MTRMALLSAALMAAFAPAPVAAQTFANFRCDDGTELPAVFYDDSRTVSLQLDGKSIHLPRRLALNGARYAKGDVVLRINKQKVTLKRSGARETVCAAQ